MESLSYNIIKPAEGKPPVSGVERSINQWIERWWNWYYSIEEKQHPSYASGNYSARNNDYNQGRTPQEWGEDAEKRVWFLAGAYGTNSTLRSIIPASETKQNWVILAPAYNMGVSNAEYPSLDEKGLEDLLKKDVDGVGDRDKAIDSGNLKVILKSSDGEHNLSKDLQRIETDWFDVTNIPEENILALDVDHIHMKSDGYWILLELAPGEHILQLYGKSNNYVSDMTFNLTVRGPGKRK